MQCKWMSEPCFHHVTSGNDCPPTTFSEVVGAAARFLERPNISDHALEECLPAGNVEHPLSMYFREQVGAGSRSPRLD